MSASRCALLLPLVACAPKRWVNPAVTDPQQVERDRYECMRENAFVAQHASVDQRGARSDQRTEVDPQMLEACMAARGYTAVRGRERDPGDPGWVARPPSSTGPVVELGAGLAQVWSADRRVSANYQPVIADPGAAPQVSTSAQLTVDPSPIAVVGLLARPSARLDLGGHQGVARSEASTYFDCDLGDQAGSFDTDELCDESSYSSASVWRVSADARLRPPSAPRLWLGGSLGLTPIADLPAYQADVTVDDSSLTEPIPSTLAVDAASGGLAPYLGLGLGVDLAHADPLGLSLSCAAELALRGARIGDAPIPEGGPRFAGGCLVTSRLSLREPAAR